MNFVLFFIKFYLLIKVAECYPRFRTQKSYVDEDVVSSYSFFEPEGRGSYAFGYEVYDFETNNVQFRDEERHSDGKVEGSYGFMAPDGRVYVTHYKADERGYRATLEGPMIKTNLKKNRKFKSTLKSI